MLENFINDLFSKFVLGFSLESEAVLHSTKDHDDRWMSALIWPLLSVCSDCEVFAKNHAAPFSKVLTFYRKEAFPLEAYYSDPKGLPHPTTTRGTNLTNLQHSPHHHHR